MSVTCIPDKIKKTLWIVAGGRCEFEGCNRPLWHDILTKRMCNAAYIAHIIADQPRGPRGDRLLSKKKCACLDNIMLLCNDHHKLIDDRNNLHEFTVERLVEMKAKHESRIESLTSLSDKTVSHLVTYFPKTGVHSLSIDPDAAINAVLPQYIPANRVPIELHTRNSAFSDQEDFYWTIEREQLRRLYETHIRSGVHAGQIRHLSIFALAPQPLLVELGTLISDIQPAVIYQKHREPDTWQWTDGPDDVVFQVIEPEQQRTNLALNISLSGVITNDRITSVLGEDTSIWTLTTKNPHNDTVRSPKHVSQFRAEVRSLFNRMKEVHGQKAVLHVFPACPASLAVELGRVRTPKADLTLSLYDQNRVHDRFIHAFNINP